MHWKAFCYCRSHALPAVPLFHCDVIVPIVLMHDNVAIAAGGVGHGASGPEELEGTMLQTWQMIAPQCDGRPSW